MNTRSASGLFDLRVWWLPDRLYEALPFLYLLIGGGTITLLDGAAGQSSGVLFMAAGCMTLTLRWRHRSARVADRVDRPVPARRAAAAARSYYNDPSY